MAKKKDLSILFIGNSHTYYNDMPLMVKQRAEDEDFNCRVTMIAHGGWYSPSMRKSRMFDCNSLYGGYDYVVLQEHAHPFGPEEKFLNAAVSLNEMGSAKQEAHRLFTNVGQGKMSWKKQKDMVNPIKKVRRNPCAAGSSWRKLVELHEKLAKS